MDDIERFSGRPTREYDQFARIARLQRDAAYQHAAALRRALGLDKKGRKRPPEAGLPVPAVPPHGPRPLEGGAAAPLDFSES